MKVVDIDPRSEEWHQWRAEGIGASEIGVLMGSDPYRSPYQLWEEKCGYGKAKRFTKAMQHGVLTEGIARKWIEDRQGLRLKDVCVEDEANSIYKASLDGWDQGTGTLVEIKCPVKEETIEMARVNSALPEHWRDQVQWQMMITEAERAYVAVWDWRADGCYLIQQWPDLKRQELMRAEADKFWHHVKMGLPPDLGEMDFPEVEDEVLEQLLINLEEKENQKKDLCEEIKQLREVAWSYGGGNNFRAYGWQGTVVQGRITYDTGAMKMDGVDIDKYAKHGASSYRLSKRKG